MTRRQAGYSMIEAMVVVAFISITSSAAVIQLKKSLSAVDADVASRTVISQIRLARQYAVDQRRNVLIEFDDNTITITRLEADGTEIEVGVAELPAGFSFDDPEVDDTPDAYGRIESGVFLGDGTFVSFEGIIKNGALFTIGPGNGTARAVTLAGASGRINHYYRNENGWVVR